MRQQRALKGKEMKYYSAIKWVDDYIRNVRAYIFVREEDNLLIKIPNQAYRINPSGVRILKDLLNGESVLSIIDRYENREEAARDIHFFFCDIRALLKGCLHEKEERRSVERIPFEIPFNSLPVLSEIALTYRCNLSCRFCYASCGCKKADDAREMSTEEVKQVLEMIRFEAMVPSVSFTGGEPTLRDDLPEIIRFAKSLGMWTNLISNGTLITGETARALKDAGLDSSQVSVEAGDKSLHDKIVRKSGAFDAAVSGVRNLMEAKIRTHTNTTVSALNKEHLVSVLDRVKSLGLERLSMNMLMPAGSALDGDDVIVTYEEIGGIVLKVKAAAEERGLEFMWYSPTPVCIFNPVVHGLGNKGCAACDGLLSISPSGDILPCSSWPKPMAGMLKIKGRFAEVWKSRGFRYFQEKRFAHGKCRQCEHLAVCNGGCPLYWAELGYGEILERDTREVSHAVFS
jgi:radical SAM protein with 4Fe4S-binding SPASM domain